MKEPHGHYAHFKTTDLQQIFGFAALYPFAAVCKNNSLAGVPDIVSVPVIRTAGGEGLEFHIARANPAFGSFAQGGKCVVLFHGPNAHISPAWYKARFADGDRSKTAPTWNYMEAKIAGVLRPMDAAAFAAHLERLTHLFEARVAGGGWGFAEISPKILQSWSGMIAGYALEVESAEAIFKLSQEQTPADRPHVIEALRARGTPYDLAIAQAMETHHYD